MDVVNEKDRLEEMLKASNSARKVPVIVDGEDVQIGYGGT